MATQALEAELRPEKQKAGAHRLPVLDGWRALSILLVLAGHLLPIGPGGWGLNGAFAASGMALFFALSGFLITQFLLHRPEVRPFLIRRLFRIVPLAWLAIIVLAWWRQADAREVLANLLFFANLPPTKLLQGGEHLWSLCLEVQFYAGVALLVALLGRRGLYLLPPLCAGVTLYRAAHGVPISIHTWERVDEILIGATAALLWHREWFREAIARLPAVTAIALLPVLIATAHEMLPTLNYFRPYVAGGILVVSLATLPMLARRLLESAPARYIAEISYALYVFHGVLGATWLGEGATVEKYLKRPFLFAATFALAHASTFGLEHRMIAIGKRLTSRSRASASEASRGFASPL